MTPLNEMCWDADIEAVVLDLTRDKIKDPDYHWSTVARVEEGRDPVSNQRITMSQLEAWVIRCKTPPTATQEVPAHADHQTRRVSPSGGHVPHS
jgi:hypothetical protein